MEQLLTITAIIGFSSWAINNFNKMYERYESKTKLKQLAEDFTESMDNYIQQHDPIIVKKEPKKKDHNILRIRDLLRKGKALTQKEIAKELGLSQCTASYLLAKMIKRWPTKINQYKDTKAKCMPIVYEWNA